MVDINRIGPQLPSAPIKSTKQSDVSQSLRPETKSLSAQEIKTTCEHAFLTALDEAEKLAAELTRNEKIKHSPFLIHIDLALASLMAYCAESNYSFPAKPLSAHDLLYGGLGIVDVSIADDVVAIHGRSILTQEEKLKKILCVIDKRDAPLFIHMLNHYLKTRKIADKKTLEAIQQLGRLFCDDNYYYEYIDLLQETAKALYSKPELYRNRLANIVGAVIASKGPLAATSTMLDIKNVSGNRLVFAPTTTQKDHDRDSFAVDVTQGDLIFIPGCGYNTLHKFRHIAALKSPVVLNDKNEFVEIVLRRVCELTGQNHISVIGGGFEKVTLPDKSVGLMVLSLIHGAGKEAVDQLIINAGKYMKPGGVILSLNPTEPEDRTNANEKTITVALVRNGFNIQEQKRYDYLLRGQRRKPGEPMWFDLPAREAIERYLLHNANPDKARATFIRAVKK